MTIHERCAGYWKGCFACAEYLPDRVFFCRRANLARFGSGEVEIESGGEAWMRDETKERKRGRTDLAGAWWNGGRFRGRRR